MGLRCLLHNILPLIAFIFQENRDFFHYHYAVYADCKYSDTFWLAYCIRLFVHYTISLSSLCKLIWRLCTYKMPFKYILSSVWGRLIIFSQLSIIKYVGLCVFSLPIPLAMIAIMYILFRIIIIIKSEVWSIIHCLGLGHETMVCAVCFYILIHTCMPAITTLRSDSYNNVI